MNIFNSLGSNYNASYVLKALFSIGSREDIKDLKNLLEERYQGKPILFYKGREALTFALEILNLPKKSKIAINGFTCVAVFNAIRIAGFEPVCLDLEETGGPPRLGEAGLNFTPETLEDSLKSNKNIKVVIVQNTLGYPCNIEKIEKLCRKHKLILIEDLAHCVETVYRDGREAGTVGDFVVLSFSQDKIIDAVSGGALLVRNKRYLNKIKSRGGEANPPPRWIFRDRFYPLETFKIRSLYKFGLGKSYHFLLKKFNLLSSAMNKSFYDFYSLPNWHAGMALYQFELLEKQLSHRRKIAKIYFLGLPKGLLIYGKKDLYDRSSSLRLPIMVENRRSLLNSLKKNGIYLSDIWYTDVAPECINAVTVSKKILNLPTHINVSEQNAKRISDLINQWIRK